MSKEVLSHESATNEVGDSTFTDQNTNPTNPRTTNEATMILHSTHQQNNQSPSVQQMYSFWAPLMQYNNSNDDDNDSNQSSLLLHYPNYSSTTMAPTTTASTVEQPPHQRPTTAWQSLSTTNRNLLNNPPIVELV